MHISSGIWPNKPVLFASTHKNKPGHSRTYTHIKDKKTGQSLKLCHQSYMFRDYSTFSKIPALLGMFFPDGADIEIDGASHGEDALSLGLILLDLFGPEEAKKYQIYASDLTPDNLERARKGIFGHFPEICRSFTLKTSWESLQTYWSRTMDTTNLSKHQSNLGLYINETPLDEAGNSHMLIKNNSSLEKSEDWKELALHEQLFRLKPETWKTLKSFVHFKKKASQRRRPCFRDSFRAPKKAKISDIS